MKVKKIGHCCLVIEIKGVRIMTDPGNYSTLQDQEKNIDIILITHEHQDHLHIDSLKKVLGNNPNAQIVTNTSVGTLLAQEDISYTIVDDQKNTTLKNILIEGYGKNHAEIYETWNSVENTGYFIDNELFYPGDALYNPERPINVLALPVAGPWIKISEAIDYALLLKPKKVFPVHDGGLKQPGSAHRAPSEILSENGIDFISLQEENEKEF